jgi:NADH-quinone oxidoreductase subunit M
MSNSYELLVLLLLPLVGAGAVMLVPAADKKLAKQIGFLFSIATLVDLIVIAARFDAGGPRFQFSASWNWIKAFGAHIAFGVDGIALVLVAMSVVLVPCVLLFSWNTFDKRSDMEEREVEPSRDSRAFFALILLLEFFMIGVFIATDVFLFYVFFEAMLIPMYFLIGSFGGPRRQYAAVKFFLYSLLGGLVMLASVIGLYVTSGTSSFAFTDLVGSVPDNTTQKWLFLGFFLAFAIKAPLVPFHTWLPDAGAEAPIGAGVLLVGVLDKVGIFGFLRYCIPLFPDASKFFAPTILVLSVIGILYASFQAFGQRDMKRLVAYTSVAHFGFIGLGTFAFTTQGQTGAVFYMVNHGLSTGALFLVVGMLVIRGKSRQIPDYSGTAKKTPILGGLFLLAGLSALALPGMSTFISEFLVLLGTFTRHKGLAVVGTTGIILAALYILLLYQRTMQGTMSSKVRAFKDVKAREVFAVAPLLVLIIALGFYPKPVTDVVNPAVTATLQDLNTTDPQPASPAAVTANGPGR